MLKYFYFFLNRGQIRSIKAKKSIVGLFVVKGFNILISLLMVPLSLSYLGETKYGIWLTLSSFIGWFSFFDIGLGNSLRNKFAEALAKGKLILARIYVSTTYAVLTIAVLIFFGIIALLNPLINWVGVFNTPIFYDDALSLLMLIVFGFFCIRFVLNLIGTILIADQKPAMNGLIGLFSSAISLIVIFILSQSTKSSLVIFAITISSSTIFVLAMFTFSLYSTKYRFFLPSYKFVRWKYAKELFSIGLHFFVIQITGIILFSTDNIIISQLFGPEEVVPYNIAFKYFGVITMGFSIITTPFWSAYTEAFTQKDFAWIRRTNKQLQNVWGVFFFIGLLLLWGASNFYKIWLGNNVHIPIILSMSMFIYVVAVTWGSIFVTFINGVGKIRMQLYISIFAGIINIPLSILLAKTFQLGSSGVIMATIICLSYGPIIAPIHFKKIISNSAEGIWNK